MIKPFERRKLAQRAVKTHHISIKRACQTFDISKSCYHYRHKLCDENARIADWLLRLTNANRPWGFGLCYYHLRNVKGFTWNHKRIYRVYRELELNLRIKPHKRIKREKPEALSVPEAINTTWSMDFMADNLRCGRKFRTFNVVDDYNREALGLEIDFSLGSERVVRALNRIIEWRGKPAALRCDNGPEYISHTLKSWAEKHAIQLCFIQPGKPQQNAYIERFNRTVRHEWLNMHDFKSIEEAQETATQWLWTYNNERPNMAIGGITPAMKLKQKTQNNFYS